MDDFPFVPVTATIFFGLYFKVLKENSESNFLTFFVWKNKTPSLFFNIFFSEIIIFAPFSIALWIKLFPSNLFPFIAKKIEFFFTLLLSKTTSEKKIFLYFLLMFGIKSFRYIF